MKFLAIHHVLAIHDDVLRLDGATPGLLNQGSIESALDRCQWGPFYTPPRLMERAALLLRGICQDHPFADGNKRTAFASAVLFLRSNGRLVTANPDQIVGFMLAVAQGELDLMTIAQWFETNTQTVIEES